MKRHHWLLLVAVVLFSVGWLFWNVVLVEQDVAAPPAAAPPAAAPPTAAPPAR